MVAATHLGSFDTCRYLIGMDQDLRSERGAAAVEFALVLPILVMLLFGIIQFGMAFNQKQGLHAAAREGARVGSIPTTTEREIAARVDAALVGVAGTANAQTTVAPAGELPCAAPGSVTVTVTSNADISIPFFGDRSFVLTGVGEYLCET